MVESNAQKISFVRVQGPCPERVTANLADISGVKQSLSLGRNTARDKVDLDFEQESKLSRTLCELFWKEPEHQNLLIRQVGSQICGFVIEDNQKIPFQLLKDQVIDIGGLLRLTLTVVDIFPEDQIIDNPNVFSPTIPLPKYTLDHKEYKDVEGEAFIRLKVCKWGRSDKKEQKVRSEVIKFSTMDLNGKKVFSIKSDFFTPEELTDLSIPEPIVDIEIEYDGTQKGFQYWTIRSKPGAERVIVHFKLKDMGLSNSQQSSPAYILHNDIYGDNYIPKLQFGYSPIIVTTELGK